jgi:Uma2 family endonuclease
MNTATETRRTPANRQDEVRSAPGTPTWEVARFFPRQGEWTEADYLALETNHLVELNHGVLEFLPMPTFVHSLITRYLFLVLNEFVEKGKLGETFFAPARVRISDEVQREPDVLLIPRGGKIEKQFTEDAALVIEIVSEGAENRKRDLVEKREDYAAAGIPEYWIVDPEMTTITVLTLPHGASEYAVHGEFQPGQTATSVLLEGFSVDVAACFAAADVAQTLDEG